MAVIRDEDWSSFGPSCSTPMFKLSLKVMWDAYLGGHTLL